MTLAEPVPQALIQASDVNTLPAQLIKLSRHRHRTVRQAVAANPSTPVETLAILARTFPHVVVANTVLDWLLLEDANWLSEFDEISRQRMMAEPGTAQSLLWWSARFGSESDRLAVTQNASASPALITYLKADGNVRVSRAAGAHVEGGPPPEVDAAIGALAGVGHGSDLVALLAMNLVPPWLIDAVDSGDVDVRRAIVAFGDTPKQTLRRLALDDDDRVRAGARAHPGLSAEFATMLDALVSAEPGADLSLITGPDSAALRTTVWAQMTLAVHPATPIDLLATMVEHQNWRIREAVCANERLPVALLARLAADPDKDVRLAVTRNRAVPAFITQIMGSDPNQQVRDAARAANAAHIEHHQNAGAAPLDGLALLLELAHHNDDTTALLAGHPDVGINTLRTLACHQDWRVRLAAVANHNAPVDIVDAGAGDADPDVRQAAVAHHSISAQALDALVADSHQEVRIGVARRSTRHKTLETLAGDSAVSVREAVAANPSTNHYVLRLLADDVELPVLHALARRPELPPGIADALARHDDVALKRILLGRSDLGMSAVAGVLGGARGWSMATRWSRLRSIDPQLKSGDVMALLRHAPWAAELLMGPVSFGSVLTFMSRSQDWVLRQSCARHPHASAAILNALATDDDYDVRCAVAAHPATPATALETLGQDVHSAVRLIIAMRADSPSQALEALTLDDDDDVRNAAMTHPALPASSLRVHAALSSGAAGSRPEGVGRPGEHRSAAAERSPNVTAVSVDTLAQWFGPKRTATTFQRRLVGRYPATPARLLRRLVSDDNWRVREDVAMHPNASRAQLTRLGGDPDRDVRRAVATHPRTPADVLIELLADSDDRVRVAAVTNPALPIEARERHLRGVLNRAARSESSIVQAVAASCEYSPALELRRRRTRQSPHWVVRYALARNPATAPETLRLLAQDGHQLVRAAAAAAERSPSVTAERERINR